MDRKPGSNQPPLQAFFLDGPGKICCDGIKYVVEFEVRHRGTKRSLFKPINVEQSVQHVAHRVQRAPDSDECSARLAVAGVPLERALQELQGLQRLTQVMARCGKEARFGPIGLLRRPQRSLQTCLALLEPGLVLSSFGKKCCEDQSAEREHQDIDLSRQHAVDNRKGLSAKHTEAERCGPNDRKRN